MDCANVAPQTVESLPDKPAREVVAIVLVEVLARIDVRVVTVGGKHGENHVLLLHDSDVITGVLKLAEPIRRHHIVSKVEIE